MRRNVNLDDKSGDLFGELKADVRVTRQRRKRSAADALRSRLVMSADFAKDGIYLSSRKTVRSAIRYGHFSCILRRIGDNLRMLIGYARVSTAEQNLDLPNRKSQRSRLSH